MTVWKKAKWFVAAAMYILGSLLSTGLYKKYSLDGPVIVSVIVQVITYILVGAVISGGEVCPGDQKGRWTAVAVLSAALVMCFASSGISVRLWRFLQISHSHVFFALLLGLALGACIKRKNP